MLLVILNWLYMGITTFLTGYAILSLFTRLTQYHIRRLISPFLAGLAVVTVYAQVYSLFAGVGLIANLLLLFLCLGILICMHGEITVFIKKTLGTKTKSYYLFSFLLLLLFAYGTSRGYMHFDTGLYHAQSIRWIEEYGVVPGLANLQARFGYNSAAFTLTALYGMAFWKGWSLHTTAGFFALLASFFALDIGQVWTEKRIRLSDFARIGLIFYLSVIFSQMVSPASDYYAQLLIFMAVILWLDTEEDIRKHPENFPVDHSFAPYALILFLLVYAVTIKFSTATMLLLVFLPAALLIERKSWKKIAGCILTGLGILTPFLIRNVIISGWLVYPLALIDIFPVDWKVPKGQVQYDAMEIGVYGKGITDVTRWDTPFSQWIGPWFANLKSLEKVWIILGLAALLSGTFYLAVCMLRFFLHRKKGGNRIPDSGFLLVLLTIAVSAVFWFASAPLVRYGYAYITLLPLLCFGKLFLCAGEKKGTKQKKYFYNIFCVLLVCFLLTRVKGIILDIARTWQQEYYIVQQDYPDGEAYTYKIDGITIYVPTENGQIGYYKFPSSPLVQNIELRGTSLKDGFRQKGE